MNRIFRTLWSVATQSWQAVPETAKTAGKKSVKSSSGGTVAAVALSFSLTGGAGAQSPPAINQLPTGGNVVRGTATIQQTSTAQAASMTVNQSSQRAVVNWDTFNLGQSASLNFVQPNAQAVTLNRVNDSNPSQIFGRITANGQVLLTNANGVYFSPTSSVDVGAITATTHSISDDNLMSGNYVFERNGSTGKVINEGRISTALSGFVALLAPEVQNAGVVVARAGTVAMAAGEMITLKLEGTGRLAGITTTPSAIASLIENKQAVQAPDGQIILSAVALNKLQAGVIKNSGNLEANSLISKGGKIYLEGDDISLASTSKLVAQGAIGGGTVLVGGDWQGSGELRQATKVTMETGATIDASATDKGNGGKVVLWSDVHNTASETKVDGTIYARAGRHGGDGGQIETSGHMLSVNNATGDAAAPQGHGGEWLFDPYNVTITTASAGGGFDANNTTSTWTSTANSSTISNATIQAKLNAGTNVKISTAASGGSEAGNITVNAAITSTSASSSLSLIADGDITINENITLGSGSGQSFLANAAYNIYLGSSSLGKSINTQGGNVLLLSNSAAATSLTNGGAIKLWTGSSVSTNGGDITLGGGTESSLAYAQGGTSANTVGVLLAGNNTLDSRGGAIVIKGSGAALGAGALSGVELDTGVTLDAGAGKINVIGKNNATASTTSTSAYGVYVTGTVTLTSTSTDTSAIAIQGVEGSAPVADNSAGISLTGATLSTTAGGISLKSDRMVWGTNTWNTSALTVAANSSGITTGVSLPSSVTFNATSDFTFSGALNKTNATRSTLSVLSNHDIAINGTLGATSGALNVSLAAVNNLSITGGITTNGGNFYVGSVALDAYDTLTTKGNDFSMGNGSFIDTGVGILNVSINRNLQLPSQTGYSNRYAITNLMGTSYYNNGALVYGSKTLSLNSVGGNITTLNTDTQKPDIVTSVDTVLTAHNIGTDGSKSNGSFISTPVKLSGPTDPYGLLVDSVNNRSTFLNTARVLTVNNLFGSSFIDEMRVQNYRNIVVSLNSQANQTQALSIMGDASGKGHLRLNTNSSGVLTLANNDVNTGGIPGTSTTDPSVFPTSLYLSNASMEFATGSVNTGSSVNYYYMGTGSSLKAYGMIAYAASFTAIGTQLTGAAAPDGVADIQSSQIYLTGATLGTSAKPVEMSACFGVGNCASGIGLTNSLDLNNQGGSTFTRITDSSYTNVNLKNINAVGEHHVWWSGGDHIDFTSDADVAYKIASIGNDANSSVNYENTAPTGINTSRLSTNLKLTAATGQVTFDTNAVNTNLGSFTVDAVGTGATSSNGKVNVGDIIYGTHTKDGQAEITANMVTLSTSNLTTPTHIVDVEIAAASATSPTNQASLTLSNSNGGNIDFTELTPGFYKTINIILGGAQRSGQKVDITLASPNGSASADSVHLIDSGTQLNLDASKVKLSEYNRNFILNATGRNLQIDGVTLGTGSYSISGQNIALNSDVLTDGGAISLYAINGFQLKKSIRIDSNADDITNSTSVGTAGFIQISGGPLSASAAGQNLVVDASSSSTNGNTITYSANSTAVSGIRVNNLTLDSGGASHLDGYINLYGTHALNNAFLANGKTLLYGAVNISSATGGDVKFTGDSMNAAISLYTLTIDTSQTTGNANGGNVDIYNTINHPLFIGSGLNINASGSGTGTSGTVDLPGMSMGTYLAPTAVTVKGGVINLHGNITTLRGGVSLTGDLRLFQDTTINTWQLDSTSTNSAAGNVTIAGVGASSQAGGSARALTINTSTNTASLDANPTTTTVDNWTQNAGTVNVSANNGSGVALASLTVNSLAAGTTNIGTSSDITVNGVITSGAQSYTGNGITIAATSQSTANNIQINALNNVSINAGLSAQTLTLTTATGKTVSGNGDLTATNLLLNATGVNYTLNTATNNQVGLLAASIGAGNLAFQNASAFTVGTIGAISGISTSGTLNLASSTGDITISNNITSTNTTANAVVINAGKSKNSRDATGGNVVFGTGIRVSLDAAATGKIYSGSLSEGSLASMVGLGSGRFRYDSDEITTNYTSALTTGLYGIYRQRPTLSSAASDVTKIYDGLAFAGSTSVTYSGYVNGDVSPNVSAYGANSTINAGSYDIVVNGAISGLGYAVTPSNFKLTVTPRLLTITATAASKIYDGTAAATVTLAGNALAGDSLTFAQTSATFADKNYGSSKTVTVSGLTFGGTSAGNYTLNGVNSTTTTANIATKALTLSGLSSSNKVYDGTLTASTSGTASLAAFEAVGAGSSNDGKAYTGDNVSITGTVSGAFNTKDVLTASLVSFSGLSLTGAQASNYSLTTLTTLQNITPSTVQLSATKTYNGNTSLTGAVSVVTGVGSETLTYANAIASDAHVATAGKYISSLTLGNGTGLASNYKLPTTLNAANAPVTINAATLTPTLSNSGVTKIYDASVNAPASFVASYTFSGLASGDTAASLSYTSASYNSANVLSANTLTVSGLSMTSITGTNSSAVTDYVLNSTTKTVAATITPKTVGLSASKIYDGTNSLTGAVSVVTDVGSETLTYSNATANDAHVASANKFITAITLANGTGLASNYKLPTTLSALNAPVTINAATLTPTLTNTGVTKIYDGSVASPSGFTPTYAINGFTSGDTAANLNNTGATYNASNVTSGGINPANLLTVSGLTIGSITGNKSSVATDYVLDATFKTVAATITPKTVGLSASKIYDGTNSLTGAVSVVTGVGSETLTYTNAIASDAHVATTGKYISSLTLGDSTGGGLATNYQLPTPLSVANALVTINAATLTPTLTNTGVTKIYDGNTASPSGFTPTYVINGFVNGDTAASLNYTSANYNFANASTGVVTPATLLIVGGMSVSSVTGVNHSASTDYVLNSSNKSIAATITPKTVGLSASKIYDGTNSLTAAVSVVTGIGSETLTYSNATANDAHVASANKFITAITLANGTGLATNYQLPTLDATTAAVTINAVTLTPTLSNTAVTKIYDSTVAGPNGFVPSYTFAGLVNGDTAASLNYTNATYNYANASSGTVTPANLLTVAGLSIASISGNKSSATTDYTLDATFKGVSATITPKTVGLSASKTYDGTTDLTGAVSVITGIGSETLTYTNATANNAHVSTANKYITTITLGNGTGLASNYQLPALDATHATASISAATLSPTLNNTGVTKIYDASSSEPNAFVASYTFSGLVSGDTAANLSYTSAAYNSSNVIGANTLTLNGLTVSSITGNKSSAITDYVLNATSKSVNATITSKTVSLSANKTYDGNTDLAGAVSITTGINNESLTYTSATASDAHVATANKYISAITLTDGTGLASNYRLPTLDAAHAAVSITPVTLTPTLTNLDITKVYDSFTSNPTGFTPSYAITGLISGDTTASLSYTSANYNTANVSTANSLTVSGMAVSSITGTNNSASTDYVLNSSSKNVAATITPKTVSLSASKTYDGSTSLTNAVSIATGVGNEVLGYTNATANDAHVATANKYISAISLTNGTGLASNYQLPTLDATTAAVTITPAQLIPTLSNTGVTKIYDGTTNGPGGFTPSYTFSGLVTGDSSALLNYTSSTYNYANVVSANQVTVAGLSIATITGNKASAPTDYVLDAISKPVNATITPKTLVVQANNDAQFVTRADTANFAGASYSGFVTNESTTNLSGALSITRNNSATTAAGVYNNVLVPGGLSSTNYNIVYQAGQYTIVPANQLLVRVANSTTTYGSSPALSISSAQYLASDNTTIRDLTSSVNTSSGVFSLTDGASGSAQFGLTLNNPTLSGAGMPTVGIWDISANNISRTSANFSNNLVVVGSQTINPKPLTISVTAANKVYDGTTIATPTLSTADALTGDNVNLLVSAANFNNKNAATAKTVAATGLGLSGIDIGNYVLQNISASTTADITPKTLNILGITAADKVYDATTQATVSTAGLTTNVMHTAGLVAGDDFHVSASGNFRDANNTQNDKNVGNNKIVLLNTSYSGADVNNYNIVDQATTTASIAPKPIQFTGFSVASSKVYDGTTDASVQGTASLFSTETAGRGTATDNKPFLNDLLNLVGTPTGTYNSKDVLSANTVTFTGISLSGANANNYTLLAHTSSAATITPKTLVVQANNDAQFVTRADTANFAGASYSGFVTNESTTNLSGALSITRNNSATTAAGVYNNVLVPGGLSSTNYNIVYQAGQYTIVPANQLLVRVANSTTTYGSSPALSISSAQYLASDNTTIRDLTSSVNTSSGVFSLTDGASGSAQFGLTLNNPTLSGAGMPTVGIWDISANNISRTSANFSNNLVVVGSQTINPKPLTISVTAANKVYDGTTIATPTLSTADALTGDNVNLLVSAANFNNKNAATAKTVAATGLGLSGIDIGNYVLQNISASTTADITPKTLTASVTAPDKVYDGNTTATPSLSITGGLVGNETLVVDATASFNSKNVQEAQRVTVNSIRLSDGTQGGLASNYSLATGQTTTAHITPKPLTATAVAEDKNYDDKQVATTALTITSGLVGRETLTVTSEASFNDSNPATNKPVVVDSVHLNDAIDGSGGLATNYSLAPGQTTSATIRPKILLLNQEPKVRMVSEGPFIFPRNEALQPIALTEPKNELPVETSEGIVFNHFKAPTENSIGIVAIRLPKEATYTDKELVVALADEIDFSHSHDTTIMRINTVDNQQAPTWIQFDAEQKALVISAAAPKQALPLQLILHLGERRYLMQISESMYID